jgi:hypothetical protein
MRDEHGKRESDRSGHFPAKEQLTRYASDVPTLARTLR